MLEGPRHQTANREAASGSHVPPYESRNLLLFGVPLSANEHECGYDTRFEQPAEDSCREKAAVVVSCSSASRCDAPSQKADAQPLCSW